MSSSAPNTNPLAALSHARARISGEFAPSHRTYVPPQHATANRPGGDLDDPKTLFNVLPAAAADGELMLLAAGSGGTQRMAANLILAFRAMGLKNMLTMAPDEATCESLWRALPSLACVWWPSIFARTRPPSLYNDMFKGESRTLAFFEARKLLLERLVI